ncbi:MAG TPA: hypothetical protein VMR45_00945 [Patescibacteria group bacterium]|nr:hypothetical protein [Patescibacteria group bacterium]
MNNFLIEERRPDISGAISRDVTKHFFTRMLSGKAAIITDRPASIMAAVRRQWLPLCRAAVKERSKTLNIDRVVEFERQIEFMKNLRIAPVAKAPMAFVTLGTVDEYIANPPECTTLYVTQAVTGADLDKITQKMLKGASVVLYKFGEE